jgi:hypothetical protein
MITDTRWGCNAVYCFHFELLFTFISPLLKAEYYPFRAVNQDIFKTLI